MKSSLINLVDVFSDILPIKYYTILCWTQIPETCNGRHFCPSLGNLDVFEHRLTKFILITKETEEKKFIIRQKSFAQ